MKTFTLFRNSGRMAAANTLYPVMAVIRSRDSLREVLKYDHVAAKYRDDRRSEANFLYSDVVPMDCDNDHSDDPADWKTPADVARCFPGVCYAYGFSRSNGLAKNGRAARPKFHVYFPIERLESAEDYTALKKRILRRFPWFDANAADAARFLYGCETNCAELHDGKTTVDIFLETAAPFPPLKELPEPNGRGKGGFRKNGLRAASPFKNEGPIPQGSRNSELSRAAGRLVKRYGAGEKALSEFKKEAARCEPPLGERELEAIYRSALRYAEREAQKPGYLPPEQYNAESPLRRLLRALRPEANREYPSTDIGAGRLFADCFKRELRFVPERKCWYRYENGRWSPDTGGLYAMEKLKQLARELLAYALELDAPDEARQTYFNYCRRWQSRPYRETVLKDAAGVHPVPMSGFDAEVNILNLANGTLHLDTLEFTEHRPEDLLTKLAGAAYDPAAKCERFTRFIEEITGGDAEKARFIQKAFGYALGGDTRFECLFILYGATTRNGKGTLCESVLRVLGSYGCAVRPETIGLQRSANGNGPSEDVARLAGVRFANIAEPSRSLTLNASLVKSMTGNDTLNARFLHENSFDFRPQFKLFINTNYRPTVTDLTLFQSNRVIVIPFERHFSEAEQDKGLKSLFAGEEAKSAILNWLLEGWRLLRTEGLNPPELVRAATEEYRHDSDKLAQFAEEKLAPCPGGEVRTAVLYDHYRDWCRDNGCFPENSRNFVQGLKAIGEVKRKRPKDGKGNGTTNLLIDYTLVNIV